MQWCSQSDCLYVGSQYRGPRGDFARVGGNQSDYGYPGLNCVVSLFLFLVK